MLTVPLDDALANGLLADVTVPYTVIVGRLPLAMVPTVIFPVAEKPLAPIVSVATPLRSEYAALAIVMPEAAVTMLDIVVVVVVNAPISHFVALSVLSYKTRLPLYSSKPILWLSSAVFAVFVQFAHKPQI